MTTLSLMSTRRLPAHRLGALRERLASAQQSRSMRFVLLLLAIFVWWHAYLRWTAIGQQLQSSVSLGFDLHYTWLAEQAFVHGGNPYAIAGFFYPPSHLLLALPLAHASFHTIQQSFLVVTILSMVATVVVSAWTIGRRPWGLTSAAATLALSYSGVAGDEVNLENVSAEIALGFAVMLFLASRRHWSAAGIVLGLTLAIKPMLLPLPIVFILVRQWRGLALALGIPAVLNMAAVFALPKGLGAFVPTLLFLLHPSGAYPAFSSALSSIGATQAWPFAVTMALRLLAFAMTLVAATLAWRRIEDFSLRLITSLSAMMLGLYLFGPISEDHYMLTLIPVVVSMTRSGSPASWLPAWLGVVLFMAVLPISPALVGLHIIELLSIRRCIGMALVLATITAALILQPWATGARTPPASQTPLPSAA